MGIDQERPVDDLPERPGQLKVQDGGEDAEGVGPCRGFQPGALLEGQLEEHDAFGETKGLQAVHRARVADHHLDHGGDVAG